MRLITAALAAAIVTSPVTFLAQDQSPSQSRSSSSVSVPRLIPLSGVFRPADGQAVAGAEIVTFGIYADETGGSPIWQETQFVQPDSLGRYSVLLGATMPDGVPQEVFRLGEARWLGMIWARGAESQSKRSRLTFVPYAVHAGDAETLGGKPASAYALASSDSHAMSTSSTDTPSPKTVIAGGTNQLAKYVNGTDITPSTVYEAGGLVGVGTTSPLDTMHVRFTDATGAVTGYAVQNLGGGAASYSGMLFYDQNGALGQFQGFNNSTHEYRINNIASGGSINFMIGGASKFRVNNNGRIDLGNTIATLSAADTASKGGATGWSPNPFNASGVIVEGLSGGEGGGFYADGDVAAIWSPGDTGAIFAVYDEDDLSAPHNGTPAFSVDGSGNINVGKGVLGCVRDGDGTILAGTCASDIRLKKDLRPFDGGMLDRLLKLRPVYYHWRTELMHHYIRSDAGEAYGLIAQDVQKIYPEMVTTDEFGYEAVDYGKLQYVTLGALQEEHSNVVALQSQVASLEQRLSRLEAASAHSVKPTTWVLLGGLMTAALGLAYVRRPRFVATGLAGLASAR